MHQYPAGHREPANPTADPWSVVTVVMHDLSSHAVKSEYNSGNSDLGAAARAAAELLEALGVRPVVPDDEVTP